MKMTKKIFMVAIATVAIALTGCAGITDAINTNTGTQGDGKVKGTKWNKKMTVDGQHKDLYDKDNGDVAKPDYFYRRFIKKIKADETVTNIATDIVIDLNNSKLKTTSPATGKTAGYAVVGLAFDFHTSEDKTKYDFVLVGFAPERNEGKGQFYVERYFDILTAKAESAAEAMNEEVEDLGSTGFDSKDLSMGTYYNFKKDTDGILKITEDTDANYDDWLNIPEGAYDATSGTLKVEIKQDTAGLYEVFLGETKVAEYNGQTKIPEDTKKDKEHKGFAQGAVAVYANTPMGTVKSEGTKVVVTYKSDKDKTNGLFEEVDE